VKKININRRKFVKGLSAASRYANLLFDLINSGVLKININQKYSLEDVGQAHRDLAGRKTIGSSILIP